MMNKNLDLPEIENKLEEYNKETLSLIFANPYSHSIKDQNGNLICCFCENKNHIKEFKDYIPVYTKVLNKEINRIKLFFENLDNDYLDKLRFAFAIKGWETHKKHNQSFIISYTKNSSKESSDWLSLENKRLLKKEFWIINNPYLCPTHLGPFEKETIDFIIDLIPKNKNEEIILKQWFTFSIKKSIINEIRNTHEYKLASNTPLPFVLLISQTNIYIYNIDFAILFTKPILSNDLERKFSPKSFQNAYIEGFEKGINNLEKEYKIYLTDFYDIQKKENLNKTLQHILFSSNEDSLHYKLKHYPTCWDNNSIKKYGFYNGFMHSIYLLKKKIGFELNIFENIPPVIKKENPYPQIFKDKETFEFFENLLEEFNIKNSKTKVSLISDIYILMRKDNLIFESFKPTPFVNWINEKYDLNISKLKELTRTPLITTTKIYNNYKHLFFNRKE